MIGELSEISKYVGVILLSSLFNPVLVVGSLVIGARIRRLNHIILIAVLIGLVSVIYGIVRYRVALKQEDFIAYAITILANSTVSAIIMLFIFGCILFFKSQRNSE